MSYTVTKLITRSWYLSSIVSRDMETVSGDQLSDGLEMLNGLLAIKTANNSLIPYYDVYDFIAVIGQEEYFIPKLIDIQTLTFDLSNVRYAMRPVQRKSYYGTARANNVNSLPYQYNVERTLDGANLNMYFLPQQNYEFRIHGKFSLNDVTLNEDLLLKLDQFYIEYLRYALSEYMCQEYNMTFAMQNQKKLDEIEQQIFNISAPDYTLQKDTFFRTKIGGDIYAQANIGHGWTRGY